MGLRWNAGIHNFWLIITFYHKYFFAVLEVRLEVYMLTPTREAINAAMKGETWSICIKTRTIDSNQ